MNEQGKTGTRSIALGLTGALAALLLTGCASAQTRSGDVKKATPIVGVVTENGKGAKIAGTCVRHAVGLPGFHDYNAYRLLMADPDNPKEISLSTGALIGAQSTTWAQVVKPKGDSRLMGDGVTLAEGFTVDGLDCATPLDPNTAAQNGDFVVFGNKSGNNGPEVILIIPRDGAAGWASIKP